MTKKFLSTALLVASMMGANAQTDTLSGNRLDEVVVTANKFPQKQSSTGKVITVITKEQIDKSAGRTVAQLLNEQAGITINGALSNLGTNPTVYMRGAQAGRTLILMDGIPVSDPSFIQNDFDLNLLSLNNIERIEIARGAQSTLYGSDAVAGVINFITTKKDVTKPLNIKATTAAGNYGTYRGNLQVFGKANKLTYNAGYAKLTSKGFSSAFDSSGKKNFEQDGYNGDVANASLQYNFNSQLTISTFGKYSRYKTDLDGGLFEDDKDYTSKNKIAMVGASINYRTNSFSLHGNYQYSENNRNYLNDSTDGFFYFTNDFFGKSQFAELYTTIELSKNISLLNGADYRYNSMNSSFITPGFPSFFADTSLSQSSSYASLFIHDNASKLNIEIGGRLNVHSRYGSNGTYTFNPSYNINNHYRLFGSLATGFKSPTLYQLYDGYSGNLDLKPEKSTTYELGFQQTHKVIRTRLVYFYRNIKNGIDYDNVLTYRYYNFLQQKVNGVELEVKANPIKGLSLSANYTFLHANEIAQSRETFKDTTYTLLLRRPKHSANIMAGYSFTNGLYVSASARYVGKTFDTGGYQAADVALNSYVILGAYAEYTFKKYVKLFVDAQNLTNKKFYEVRGYNSIPLLVNGGVVFSW